MKMVETKFDSTYSAVVSMAEQLVGEGKYDSTYSAVLAIYQNLTSDVDTKFDSVYSIVVKIADGIESGDIDLGGGDCPDCPEFITQILTQTITKNGTYNYTPTTDGYSQVDITVDVDIPEFTTETLTETITTNGTYNYTPTVDGFSSVDITVNVQGSGGGDSDENGPRNTHQFYDYLGNLVEEWTLEETQEKTELPTASGFTLPDGTVINHDGWNWDLEDIKSETYGINIGALYRTQDDNSYYIVDTQSNNTVGLPIKTSSDTTYVDWGDGVVELLGTTHPYHTYQNGGKKVIKVIGYFYMSPITEVSIDEPYSSTPAVLYMNGIKQIFIGEGSEIGSINLNKLTMLECITFPNIVFNFGTYQEYLSLNRCGLKYICCPKVNPNVNYTRFEYANRLENVSLSKINKLSSDAFANCTNLKYIKLHDSIMNNILPARVFQSCYSLRYINRSLRVNGERAFESCSLNNVIMDYYYIPSYCFNKCNSLSSIDFNNIVTGIGNSAFNNCRSLQSIKNFGSITTLNDYVFYGCVSLNYIKLPSTLTSIGSYVFAEINEITIDLSDCTQVPTLSSTNSFTSYAIILVPESLYDEWIATTNWSSLSSQIKPVPGK